MNIKTKKKLNYSILIYIIGVIFTAFLGALLGIKVSMLKVHASTFPNSTITYNEGQVLYRNETDGHAYISINEINSTYTITLTYYYNGAYIQLLYNRIYTNCSYNNGTITCNNRYDINYNSTANSTVSNNSATFTVNSDSITLSNNTYTILSSGYTQSDLDQAYADGQNSVLNNPHTYGLYTTAEYNANYTAGQNSVLNSPNTYNLYTSTQYTNYGTSQYNSGYSAGSTAKENDILTNPNNYGLYSSAQYTAYGTAQYNAGLQYVQDNPNTYNLYTTAQYTAYGTSQYNSGILAGQNDVINNPHNYNLYTSTEYSDNYTSGQNSVINDPHTYNLYTNSEYNTYGTNQYNAGYLAGLNDNNAYNLGIQHVIDNPHDYNLYTQTDYNNYGSAQYNAGVQYVVNNPNEYNLYTTVEYNDYGTDQYSLGYQAGIEQGETNVVSNPNDYNLYTENQYINNASYSDFIENQISSVWVSQPILNNGYYTDNWVKINNSNLIINEGTIQLDTLYANNNNIDGIRIYFKTYLTNDLPLSFNNILNESDYQYTSVYLKCFIDLPNNNINDGINNTCQTTPGLSNNNPNYLGLEYNYLVNNINYFDALEQTGDPLYSYYNYLKYNCLEISNYTTSPNSLNYLNGTLNTINYDISSINLTSYNMGYDKGYQYGQKANQQAEYNRGYTAGYDDAEQLYVDTSGNGNTLVGLAGTILFSPVQMMKEIFNFEILGVNLAGFILSIITLIVVAWLIKRLI